MRGSKVAFTCTPFAHRVQRAISASHVDYMIAPLEAAGFRVDVFDAAAVGQGPVATAAAPGGACTSIMLHAAWMPRAVEPPSKERLAFSDELSERTLGPLDDHATQLARQVAADLDEALG